MSTRIFRLFNLFLILALGLPAGLLSVVNASSSTSVQEMQNYSISGRVVDGSGNPLSGVTIHAIPQSYPIVFVHGFKGFPPKFITG